MTNYDITWSNLGEPLTMITLKNVIDAVSCDTSIPIQTRRDLVGAVHKIAELIAPDGLNLPADVHSLAVALRTVSPAMTGLSANSFANTKSRFRRALMLAGVNLHPGRQTNELSAEWQALRDKLDQDTRWRPLSRLAHHASAQGWEPGEIDDTHIAWLLHLLDNDSLHTRPYDSVRRTCKTWNACILSLEGWTGAPLTIPLRREPPYTLRWEDFDEGLRREVDQQFERLCNPSPFSIAAAAKNGPSPLSGQRSRVTRRPIARSTAATRRFQVLQYLSALVRTGTRIEELTDLNVATHPDLVERGLTFFYKRAGERMAVQIGGIGQVLIDIAKHGLKDPDRAAQISAMLSNGPRARGMSKKVEGLLRQFDDPRNLRALHALPTKLMKIARATRATAPSKAARIFETALAIEVLIICPLRIGNLVSIDLDKHFLRSRPGPECLVHLVIPAEEVKNRRQLEFVLPDHLTRMLREHLERFRVYLPGATTRWLFPREGGKHVVYKILSGQLSMQHGDLPPYRDPHDRSYVSASRRRNSPRSDARSGGDGKQDPR